MTTKKQTAADKLKGKKPEKQTPDLGAGQPATPDLGAGGDTSTETQANGGESGDAGKTTTPTLEVVTGQTPGENGATDFEAPVTVPKTFKVEKAELSLGETMARFIQPNDNSTGLVINSELKLPEWLIALDYFTGVNEQSGWFIGDMLLFAEKNYGKSYIYAMAKTGRKLSTLKSYYGVAKAFPEEKRVPGLSWQHHKIAQRVVNSPEGGIEKAVKLLKDAKKGDDGETVPTRLFSNRVDAAVPKKKKGKGAAKAGDAKRGPKGKNGKNKPGANSKLKPYEPNAEEIAALDNLFDELKGLDAAATEVLKQLDAVPSKESKLTLLDVILKGENNRKKGFRSAVNVSQLQRLVKIDNLVETKTGYTS